MMRVALTGGTGFIGANLARALIGRGYEVHLVNRAKHSAWRIESINADVTLHVADLAERASVEQVLRTIRPEVVFHLAQAGGYAWQTDVGEMVSTNYLACVNLLHAAEACGARLVINAGSSSEYGLKPHPARETDDLKPNSDYAATKAAATLYCGQWARRTGRPALTLRLYSVYGPFEEPMRLLPRLISFALAARFPPLASPMIARDLVYVDDVVAAFLRAVETPHSDPAAIFNICSGQQRTLHEIVGTTRKILKVTAEPDWGTMKSREWDTEIWVGDPARVRDELGWRATTSLEAGIGRFAEWLKSEPGMHEHYRNSTGFDCVQAKRA